jgi:hypothetical protein
MKFNIEIEILGLLFQVTSPYMLAARDRGKMCFVSSCHRRAILIYYPSSFCLPFLVSACKQERFSEKWGYERSVCVFHAYKSRFMLPACLHICFRCFRSWESIIIIIIIIIIIMKLGMRNAYKLLLGKPEGNKPLGRPRHRWVDNIRMDLGEVGSGSCGLDCSGSGQGQVESSCECGNEPSDSIF